MFPSVQRCEYQRGGKFVLCEITQISLYWSFGLAIFDEVRPSSSMFIHVRPCSSHLSSPSSGGNEHGRTQTNINEPYLRGRGEGTNMEEHWRTWGGADSQRIRTQMDGHILGDGEE